MAPADRRPEGGAVMVQSLDRSQGRQWRRSRQRDVGAVATTPSPAIARLQIEEPLIFEMGQPGRCGVDLPEPPKVKDRLNGLKRAGEIGLPGLSEPQVVQHYTRPQPEELRHRHGRLPAGLVHHEAQPAHQREGGAPAWHRRPASPAAGLDRAGCARADRPPGALAEDADRHAGRGDVAGRRRAWRDVRHDGDRRRPRGARRAGQAPGSCWRRNRRTAPTRRRRRRWASPSSRSRPTSRGRVDLDRRLQGGARAPTWRRSC